MSNSVFFIKLSHCVSWPTKVTVPRFGIQGPQQSSSDYFPTQSPTMPFLPTGLLAGCTPPPELGSGWFLVDNCSIYLSTARSHSPPRLNSGLAPPSWHFPRFLQDAVNPSPGVLASGASPTASLPTGASYSSDQLSWTGNYWRWNLHRAGLKSNWRLTNIEQRTPRPSGLCWVSTIRPILSWEK